MSNTLPSSSCDNLPDNTNVYLSNVSSKTAAKRGRPVDAENEQNLDVDDLLRQLPFDDYSKSRLTDIDFLFSRTLIQNMKTKHSITYFIYNYPVKEDELSLIEIEIRIKYKHYNSLDALQKDIRTVLEKFGGTGVDSDSVDDTTTKVNQLLIDTMQLFDDHAKRSGKSKERIKYNLDNNCVEMEKLQQNMKMMNILQAQRKAQLHVDDLIAMSHLKYSKGQQAKENAEKRRVELSLYIPRIHEVLTKKVNENDTHFTNQAIQIIKQYFTCYDPSCSIMRISQLPPETIRKLYNLCNEAIKKQYMVGQPSFQQGDYDWNDDDDEFAHTGF